MLSLLKPADKALLFPHVLLALIAFNQLLLCVKIFIPQLIVSSSSQNNATRLLERELLSGRFFSVAVLL